jgi:GMP synthase (glutamine-hydrolysing)
MAGLPSPGMEGEKLALAVRRVHFEGCGTLGDVLVERGFTVRYVEAGRDALNDLDVSTADLVISLGGPVAVYDGDRYPWIRDELNFIERSLARQKPILGICLGAQMVAHVLGARVYPSPVKELGWKPLLLSEEGKTSVIASLAPEVTSLLHWHGDTFDLPQRATLLASRLEAVGAHRADDRVGVGCFRRYSSDCTLAFREAVQETGPAAISF